MAEILPPPPVGEPFASYQWDDWYRKVRKTINDGQTVSWSSITGKPVLVEGTRTINTTAPLTGGGNLSADRTLGIDTFTTTTKGAVPAGGTVANTYLRQDATFEDPLNRGVVVTGSRSAGTALTNLLTALASLGIILDTTTV